MFNILKRNKNTDSKTTEAKQGFFERLKHGLTKTRTSFTDKLGTLLLGKKELDEEVFETIETQLLLADVGVEATQYLIDNLAQRLKRKELNDIETAITTLKVDMVNLLKPSEKQFELSGKKPYMILVIGINGSGKTTTIGKLAHHLKQDNKSVMLAAADTFRAAAIDQLQAWGEKNQIAVISQQPGSDPASVVYDAFEAAKARNIDVLLADTAGRLHTQTNLMTELQKVKRVVTKLDPSAPHETLLVLDASIGQNALNQAKEFNEAIGVTGLVLTKLDGTAKGGIIFAIAKQLNIPIKFIGVGESLDDLRPFNAEEFVAALFE
ncbi:MAG TPA: signal recognition particle-docking protein FtsY [Gammaproteobacteria bacterium]|nr:signal recognition particle-docking protein FtsY [Gammaproteobacteria bacterium]